MTETIMADFEEERPETVFPDTERVLFLGGPKHGETLEVVQGDPIHRVIGRPQTPPIIAPDIPLAALAGVPEVHSYMRREFILVDDRGDTYKHTVYVHEAVPNPAIAQRLLVGTLLAQWVRQGERVPPDGVSEFERRTGG